MASDTTTVFYFPIKGSENGHTRENETALDALNRWELLQDEWCEHKPSCTINVREEEWMEVGAWVYEKFDKVSGISFLPYGGGSYKQAPYQELTEGEYEAWIQKNPTPDIDWSGLTEFEKEDTTTGSQELACTGNSCEVTDILGGSNG